MSRAYSRGRVTAVYTAGESQMIGQSYDDHTGALVWRWENSGYGSRTVDYSYELGRLAASDGTRYAYDRLGNLATVTDVLGRTSSFVYDDAGRLVASSTPSGGTTSFGYTAAGALALRRDADGRTMSYAYDALGRLLSETGGGGAAVTYGYDGPASAGRLVQVQDVAGTTSFAYDALGRVAAEIREQSGATNAVGYAYDAASNVAGVIYPGGTVLTITPSSVDPGRPGQVSRQVEAGAAGAVLADGITWGAGGALAGLTYGNAAQLMRTTALDGAPQLIDVSDPQSPGSSLWRASYTAVDYFGRPRTVVRQGPGFVTATSSYGYDDRGQLTSANETGGGATRSRTYGYQAWTGVDDSGIGNRVVATKSGPQGNSRESYAMGSDSVLYSYSDQSTGVTGGDDRLRLLHRDGGDAVCRGYDASGNLVSTGFGTAALDVATACGAPLPASCFEHDDWGRVTVAGRTQVDGSCQPYWRYAYDYKGRRVEVAGEGQFAARGYRFVYDQADRLLTEIAVGDDGETPEHSYYYLAGEPLAMERLGDARAVFYFHNDHLGTPQRLSQADGTVKWAARYSPFGELGPDDVNPAVDCQDPPLENPLRFPGQYDDARKGTGFFYYNYHRYYDPAVGRYTQPDPAIFMTGGDERSGTIVVPPAGNIFAYAGSEPLTRVDPTGERWVRGGEPYGGPIACYTVEVDERKRGGKPKCPCNKLLRVRTCEYRTCSAWMWEQEGPYAWIWPDRCYGSGWFGGPNSSRNAPWESVYRIASEKCVSPGEPDFPNPYPYSGGPPIASGP